MKVLGSGSMIWGVGCRGGQEAGGMGQGRAGQVTVRKGGAGRGNAECGRVGHGGAVWGRVG